MFDEVSELLWTTDSAGYVRSFEGPTCSRYTSVRSSALPVMAGVALPFGVGAIAQDGVRIHAASGLSLFHMRFITR